MTRSGQVRTAPTQSLPKKRGASSKRSTNKLQDIYSADKDIGDGSGLESDDNEFTRGLRQGEDEEIDSDDAFDSGEEANFTNFSFRGSSKRTSPPRQLSKWQTRERADFEVDLSEHGVKAAAESEGEETASDFEADTGDDLMDLSEMLQGTPSARTSTSVHSASDYESEQSLDTITSSEAEGSDHEPDSASGSSVEESELERPFSTGVALQEFVRTLDSKRKHDTAFSKPSTSTENHRVSNVGQPISQLVPKLRMEDLTGALGLQHVKALERTARLDAPLSKPIRDRVNRAAAYETVKEEISTWQPAVRAIREAPVLKFPLMETQPARSNSNSLAATFSSQNPMEEEIQQVLQTSDMQSDKAVSAFEELAMSHLSVEDVKKRRAELALMRDLLFRQERKAKRQNKIKSKTYRKVHRREREKLNAALGQSQEDDQDIQQRQTEQRARERMELRHKNTSKWAKKMLGRADHGEGSRAAITEQIQRGEELERKIRGVRHDDSDGEIPHISDEAGSDQELAPRHGVFAMKFMQASSKVSRDDEGDSDESDVDHEIPSNGRRSFAPTQEPINLGSHRDASQARKTKPITSLPEEVRCENEESSDDDNPWFTADTTRQGNAKTVKRNQDIGANFETKLRKEKFRKDAKHITGTPVQQFQASQIIPMRQSESDATTETDLVFKQTDLVAQAFAGDDVVANFEQDKSKIKHEDAPQVIDETLPGWGSWTGEGLKKKPSKRFTKQVAGIPVSKRRDAKLQHVIINEKRLKQAKPYMSASVPFPYETKEQYERSLRMPLGPEWSSRTSFQKSIMPHIVTKQGRVIAPMSK